ncbi:MAG: hypothetical protein LAP40_04245 [Acidobacteriia bacterium]|nr:hypothetical protein [Terriglobia bacterium]
MQSSLRKTLTGAILIAGVSVPLLLAVEASREPACTRGCLLEATNDYLEAMLAHKPSALRVASDLKATENGKPLRLGDGLWKTAKGIPYRQSFADPATGQAGFFGVVTEDSGDRALFVLRLKVSRQRIAEVETLVARNGATNPLSLEPLTAPNLLFEETVPDADRVPSETLLSIANSYFEGLEAHREALIPFHPDCNRWENGVQVTNTGTRPMSCPAGIPAAGSISKVRGRRFPIADEARGLVLGIAELDIPAAASASGNGPHSVLLYQLFKVESGRIKGMEAFRLNVPLGASNGWE